VIVGLQCIRRFSPQCRPSCSRDDAARASRDGPDDFACDLVLYRENIIEISIVLFGPYVAAAARIDHLSGYAHEISGFPHTSFQNVLGAELLTDGDDINVFPFVLKGDSARENIQVTKARKLGNDVLGQSVAEIFLLRVAAHICEGKHRDCASDSLPA